MFTCFPFQQPDLCCITGYIINSINYITYRQWISFCIHINSGAIVWQVNTSATPWAKETSRRIISTSFFITTSAYFGTEIPTRFSALASAIAPSKENLVLSPQSSFLRQRSFTQRHQSYSLSGQILFWELSAVQTQLTRPDIKGSQPKLARRTQQWI